MPRGARRRASCTELRPSRRRGAVRPQRSAGPPVGARHQEQGFEPKRSPALDNTWARPAPTRKARVAPAGAGTAPGGGRAAALKGIAAPRRSRQGQAAGEGRARPAPPRPRARAGPGGRVRSREAGGPRAGGAGRPAPPAAAGAQRSPPERSGTSASFRGGGTARRRGAPLPRPVLREGVGGGGRARGQRPQRTRTRGARPPPAGLRRWKFPAALGAGRSGRGGGGGGGETRGAWGLRGPRRPGPSRRPSAAASGHGSRGAARPGARGVPRGRGRFKGGRGPRGGVACAGSGARRAPPRSL